MAISYVTIQFISMISIHRLKQTIKGILHVINVAYVIKDYWHVIEEDKKTGENQHYGQGNGADEDAVDGIQNGTEAYAHALRGDTRQNHDEQESVKPKPLHGLAGQRVRNGRINQADHNMQR